MTNESSRDEFNIEEWRSRGEQAYRVLCESEAKLEKELEDVRKRKEEIATVLGIEGSSPQKRVRIRPVIIESLTSLGGAPVTPEELCAEVCSKDERFLEKSVRISLNRLIAESDTIRVDDQGLIQYSVE